MRLRPGSFFTLLALAVGWLLVVAGFCAAGDTKSAGYQVLEPIGHGRLTVFPIVAAVSHDTREFLTLDEGLRSGEVVITEAGSVAPLIRPRRSHPFTQYPRGEGAEVNRLVLVNNSKHPLVLLAGEIVTGGKQDRIIAKDRLVPAESDPVDLSVFCVEPGRWQAASARFKAPAAMVQPSVRSKAMAEKDQREVWTQVASSKQAATSSLSLTAQASLARTSSYAELVQNPEVRERLDRVAAPVEEEYRSVIGQLRDRNAVGVVVAVNGEIIWADIFASTSLLEKYWPKLIHSYAAEALTTDEGKPKSADRKAAQEFLDQRTGRREIVENEPGLYRHSEVAGDGFKLFELTSLLPNTGFDLHEAKMAE
jgi:hypothetical protein